MRRRCSQTENVSWSRLEVEAEGWRFRVMSRPESPVKVEISEVFVFTERAKV